MQSWQLALHCVLRQRLGIAAAFTVCYVVFSRRMQSWKNIASVHTEGCSSPFGPFLSNWIGLCWLEGMGWFESKLKKCLGCSLAGLCSGFCLLRLQPLGVSFCAWLFSVVSCTLPVFGCLVAAEPRLTVLTAYLVTSGHFRWDSNQKCRKRG